MGTSFFRLMFLFEPVGRNSHAGQKVFTNKFDLPPYFALLLKPECPKFIISAFLSMMSLDESHRETRMRVDVAAGSRQGKQEKQEDAPYMNAWKQHVVHEVGSPEGLLTNYHSDVEVL